MIGVGVLRDVWDGWARRALLVILSVAKDLHLRFPPSE